MSIDKKILKEIQKYNTINKYISEQFDAEAPETDVAAPTDTHFQQMVQQQMLVLMLYLNL